MDIKEYEIVETLDSRTCDVCADLDGKEIPLYEEPVLLKKISYEDKDNVLKELKSFEKNAIKEDIETACVITKDGEVFKCF